MSSGQQQTIECKVILLKDPRLDTKNSQNNTNTNKSLKCCLDEPLSSSHLGSKNTDGNILNCETCDKTFFSKESLKKHKQRKHGNCEKTLKCQYCSKTFFPFDKASYRRHVWSMHDSTRERNHKCSECDALFFTSDDLKVHKRRHFQVRLECMHCHKDFANPISLKNHLITHDQNRKRTFKCEQCSKAFFTPLDVSRHTRNVHGIQARPKCSICSKDFKTEAYLRCHFKNVHFDNTSRFATCPVCQKQITKVNMKRHQATHDEQEIYFHVKYATNCTKVKQL